MKFFAKLWKGALCLSLLLTFFSFSDTEAQTTRYVDLNNGVNTGECPSTAPCSLSRALDSDDLTSLADGDIVAIRVRREGETVTISGDISVPRKLLFAAYQRGSVTDWVKATFDFTGTVTIEGGADVTQQAQFRRDENLTVRFKDVNSGTWTDDFSVNNPNNDPFGATFDEKQGGYSISGTLTTHSAKYEELMVTSDLTIVAPKTATGTALATAPIVVVDSLLEVKKNVTLTIGTKDQRIDLRVPLKKRLADTYTAKKGSELIVAGKIDGIGRLWIAHQGVELRATEENERAGFFAHHPQEYNPSDENVVDHEDCMMITDGVAKEKLGEIAVGIYGIAVGNLCIDLPKVSDIIIGGSISLGLGNDGEGIFTGPADYAITSDVFFREDVVIDGNVQQWGDARIVFEKKATINGSVILANENVPASFTALETFGRLRTGDRGNIPNSGNAQNYIRQINVTNAEGFGGNDINTGAADCNVNRTEIRRGRAFPGVQFQGETTIEDNLDLRFDSNTAQDATQRNVVGGSICETKALFLADTMGTSEKIYTSTVGGDLIIEDGGLVYLDGGNVQKDATKAPIHVGHNLSVAGDIFADGAATEVMTNHAAESLIDGVCSDKSTMLDKGTRLTLSGPDHEILTHSDGLTIPSLVILGEAEVEGDGTLVSTTMHIGGSGGELVTNGKVQVGSVDKSGHLILQADGLNGKLTDGSMLSHLTYASSSTDAVTADELDVLEIHLDTSRLRLEDTRTEVKTVGLCSGTLVLGEVETVKGGSTVQDTTLYVTEKLVVQAGSFELDSSNPGRIGTDKDAYILQYVNTEERTAGPEWFAPRKVAVTHKDAVVVVNEAKMLSDSLHIVNGHLHFKGDGSNLVIGKVDAKEKSDLTIDEGELHTNGNNVQVYGTVTVGIGKKVAKIMTDGGELHVLGKTTKKDLDNATAVAMLGEAGTIDVGSGALQLGPETTNPVDGLHGDWMYGTRGSEIGTMNRPHVKLDLHEKAKVMGAIRVPKGSKQTEIIGTSFGTIVFDGTKTPEKAAKPATMNWEGTLYISPVADGKNVTLDSLSASNGAVEFYGAKFTITKDVAVSSAKLHQQDKALEFKGDLAISGTGGLTSRAPDNDNRRSLTIGGDFSQETEKVAVFDNNAPVGARLTYTDKTVMGTFKTSGMATTTQYSTEGTKLNVNGDFHFGLSGDLAPEIEFSGKKPQKVKSSAMLGNVTVNNSKGIALDGAVTQSKAATLTLTRGVISGDSAWVVTNPMVEADLVASVRVTDGGTIYRSSRLSYLASPLKRSIASAGDDERAGYLFPAGANEDGKAYYRPLILQLPADEDATTVTVAPEMIPSGATPAWPAEGLRAPAAGETLTLDAYADMFWRIEVGDGQEDELLDNPSIRVQAGGINNVFDAKRLRIVQWNCDWTDARLAGQYNEGENADDSFAFNGYIGGRLNLTQTGIALGSCSILGIAANGIENPIHLSSGSTVQVSQVQFIHNAVLPAPVGLSLDGASIAENVTFQNATGYQTITAGSHTATIQPAGAPASSAISVPFTTKGDQAYVVIANGAGTNVKTNLLETRLTSSVDEMVEAIFVHGVSGAGKVNIRSFSPDNHDARTLLTLGLDFNEATRYISLKPEFHNLEITLSDSKAQVGVFSLDLNGYQGETLVIAIGGTTEVSVMAVDKNGTVRLPTNVTSAEDIELPSEFSLHGNYPNPFNPSTRIQFDLPESAQVSLQVVDMLGREVMALPYQDFEAGSNRSIELNATSLASGTYLYRMIANGAESRYVKTGRMTLVK